MNNTLAEMLSKFYPEGPKQNPLQNLLGHHPTRQRHHKKSAFRSPTKASHEESKVRRKMAAKSRKINRRK